jgi:hypothetical protein
VIIDADGPWTAAAKRVVDRGGSGKDHGVADDGGSFCGLGADRIEVCRHPFNVRSRNDCRACTSRLYELAGLAGKGPAPDAWARSVLRWTAWVTNGADASIVTDALERVLIGRSITAVRYADLDYETEIVSWYEGDHDVVGHGIELDLDDGTTWSVIWEQRGDDEGLGVWRGPLVPEHLKEARFWNVTDRWCRRGPREIAAVEIFWWPQRQGSDDRSRSALSLGGLVLHDAGRDRQVVVALDERFDVRVYFSRGRARRDGYFTDNYVTYSGTTVRGTVPTDGRDD